MKILFLTLLLIQVAFAHENDLLHRPNGFSVLNDKAIFVDFKEASYDITYDVEKKQAFIQAQIKFMSPENGLPIFDSVENPDAVKLDGISVESKETKTPSGETTLRVINKKIESGEHTLEISLPLKSLVSFQGGGVKSAFWTSDLSERQYLERYMPANFEFDQVKMEFNIKFIGLKAKQAIYTNGIVTKIDANNFKVSYPSYYTSSSIFFHTVPAASVKELRFVLKSIDGREIPAVVYFSTFSIGVSLERLKDKVTNVFHELESDYGAFLHPSITIYQAGAGGMEYCGATMTDFSSLGHEMFHSYFARGVMPANGNAGWLDEALASWRDDGYSTITTLSGSSRMSAHPYYTRITDEAAYSFGERFMSYLDGKFSVKGGLRPFMRYMVENKKFSPLFVEDFISEMSNFYGVDVAPDFKRYTFGSSNLFSPLLKFKTGHVHRKMTLKELQNYL